jgi:valyl-tRNA synthetase
LGSFYLDLSSGVNVEEEKARISKETENLQRIIQSIENKLKNEKFVSKAPEAVVAGAQAQLAENQAKLKESEDILNALSR